MFAFKEAALFSLFLSQACQGQTPAGSGMKPAGSGSGMKPDGIGSGMKPDGSGSGMKPDGSGSGMRPDGSGSGMEGMFGSGNGMGGYDSGMGGYGSGIGGYGGMGGNIAGMGKKKLIEILKIFKKLWKMVMGLDMGEDGDMMEQWKMLVKKILNKVKEGKMDWEMGMVLKKLAKLVMGGDMQGEGMEDKEQIAEHVKMMMERTLQLFTQVMIELGGGMGMLGIPSSVPEALAAMMEEIKMDGLMGMGSGMGVDGGMGMGIGGGMGMGGDLCCQYKKIWGSGKPKVDGIYVLVSPWMPNLPYKCESSCVYQKKGYRGQKFCFAPSKEANAQCIADNDDGEEPFVVGYGSGMKPGGYGSGMKPGGSGSGMKPGGYGSGMKPGGYGSGMKPGGYGSGMKPSGSGSGMNQIGSGSGINPTGSEFEVPSTTTITNV